MAEFDLSLAPPLAPSAAIWVETVLADFNTFLSDHASCEKKASGMALNVAAHYPDQPLLLNAMSELAVEELNHYRQVIKIMLERNLVPLPDTKDPYVHALNGQIRKGSANFLLDRLLVGAVIERRGAERFQLIADHIEDQGLKTFYTAIANSEARHWTLFVELALDFAKEAEVMKRLNVLCAFEQVTLSNLPLRAALH